MIRPTLSYLNDVYFGQGLLSETAGVILEYGVRRPLVVTDRQLRAIGVVENAGLSSFPVFDDVETNPTEQRAAKALDVYRDSGCDGLVAIGGGSPIDLSKIVGLMINHTGPLSQYAILESGPASVNDVVPPIVAVPTTAGSGSEVGRAALVTVLDGRKLGFLSHKLLPVAAVCDPEVTASMPYRLKAATGMDALSHCVEAILSPRENPAAEAFAVEGLIRGSRAIRRVVRDDASPFDRAEMMWCSLFGGMAFQKGLGAVHSLSHPLGRFEQLRLHHGTLNGLFLPAVLRFNATVCCDSMQTVSRAIGGVDPAAFFEDLLRSLGLPRRLSELGVGDPQLVSSSPLAAADHCTATNPRTLGEQDALDLYRSCL